MFKMLNKMDIISNSIVIIKFYYYLYYSFLLTLLICFTTSLLPLPPKVWKKGQLTPGRHPNIRLVIFNANKFTYG